MFIDEASIATSGGDGGNGCLSFRREKYVPQGGPDGGDGGHGGSVILVATRNASSLLPFRYNRHHRADRGRHGLGANKTGRSGEDLIVEVPVGTVVLDEDGVSQLADLSAEGERFVAAAGGRGGRGNARFSSSVNRAPTRHDAGQVGERRDVRLVLKLLADAGLVGLPNAGKSTLISRLSAARPKIADYPFTTLEPQLGVVDAGDYRSFVIADIPGLIEGAHQGAGLGHRFLRHVERCRLLLHLVDPTAEDPIGDMTVIVEELRGYSELLVAKPRVVVATKQDVAQEPDGTEALRRHAAALGLEFFCISAVQGAGLKELVRGVAQILDRLQDDDIGDYIDLGDDPLDES